MSRIEAGCISLPLDGKAVSSQTERGYTDRELALVKPFTIGQRNRIYSLDMFEHGPFLDELQSDAIFHVLPVFQRGGLFTYRTRQFFVEERLENPLHPPVRSLHLMSTDSISWYEPTIKMTSRIAIAIVDDRLRLFARYRYGTIPPSDAQMRESPAFRRDIEQGEGASIERMQQFLTFGIEKAYDAVAVPAFEEYLRDVRGFLLSVRQVSA